MIHQWNTILPGRLLRLQLLAAVWPVGRYHPFEQSYLLDVQGVHVLDA